MKIRLTQSLGYVHGRNTQKGDVIDIDDANAIRYCHNGYAEPVTKTAEKAVERDERTVERAIANEGYETTALEAAAESQPDAALPKPLDDEDESDDSDKKPGTGTSAASGRRRGR
jgi:hypothetical protein